MRRADGVEACKGIVEAEHLHLDANTKGKSGDAAAVGAAELLATHVVVASAQVETFGNQKFCAENSVAEQVVHYRKLGFNCVAAQVDLRWRILVVVNQVWCLQVGRGERKAQRHVLEALRNAYLNLEWQRCVDPVRRFPLRQVESHVAEDHSSCEKPVVADIGAAEVEAHRKMRTVTAHVGVDQLEIRPNAEAIHLSRTADHKGEVRSRETAGLVAINIRFNHLSVAQKLDSAVEIADILKGMGVPCIAVSDVAQIVSYRHGHRLMHRVIGKRRIHQGIVQVMVVGGNVHASQG